METTDISRDKLISDMKVVIADADELLRATAGQAGEKVAAARARIQDSMDGARIKLAQFGDASAEKAKAAARAPDDSGHEHPAILLREVLLAIIAAFCLGLGIVFAALFFVFLFWDNPALRLAVICIFALVFL